MIAPDTLAPLLQEADPAVTIHCPADPTDTDAGAVEARLRQLIGRTDELLVQRGLDEAARGSLLAPVRDAAAAADFSQHREAGLAFFARPGGLTVLPLPGPVRELAAVGGLFNLRPYVAPLARNRRFWVVALSAERARLYAATPFSWEERRLELVGDELQAELDSRAAVGGPSSEEVREALLTQDPRRVAASVRAAIADDDAPVVLVAEPRAAGHFSGVAHLRNLHPEALHLNPFAFGERELHARVTEFLAPVLDAELAGALEQAAARLGTAEADVAIRLEEILAAAHDGRVGAVVIAEDESLWGRFDRDRREVVAAHGAPSPGDEDLLNEAAVVTLRNSGRAYAAPRARLPRQVAAVALYRY